MAIHNSFAAWAPRLLSVLRIVSAFLLLAHGTQKILGFPPRPPAPGGAAAAAGPVPWYVPVSGWLELVGGILLLIGLFTRPVAFILSGMMACAYFIGHALVPNASFWPILNRGELAALYCFVFLYLAAAGGGPWSVDSLIRRGGAGRDRGD